MELKIEVCPAYAGDTSMFPIKETIGKLQYHPEALKMYKQRELKMYLSKYSNTELVAFLRGYLYAQKMILDCLEQNT